ncbi:MAG: LacI family DNA-binding transcriptional regulator [Candidatus Cryptobacteroides sp.]
MKETLADLAAKTGFSITTISRVLSGKADKNRISQETRDTIMKAAEESNYFPNLLAKNLRTSKTNTIGLMLPSVANPFFADIASVVIKEARKRKHTTIVIDTDESPESEKSAISSLISHQVAGIMAVPCGEDPALFEEIHRNSLPVILIDRYFSDSTLPYVTTNNYLGSILAVNHLIMRGHSNIACIQGVTTSLPNKKRVSGYMSALEKAGIKDSAIVVGNEFSEQNGYLETKLLLNRENRPTAIYALSNTILLGALRAVREAGLRVPQDISLIAFDNSIYMDYMTPSITRISQPTEEMGKLATKLLFDSIASGSRYSTQLELAPELILRNSV